MYNFVILTDNTVDMPVEWLNEHEVGYECLPCSMNGVVYDKKNPIDTKLFYRQMREGAMPTTSQMNPAMAEAMFETYLQEGKDILYLAFSSGLSGTCNSARIAAEELKEKYPLRYNQEGLTGPAVIEELYRQTKGDAIIVTEVGQHQMWAAQYYKYKKPHTLITSGGLGTMGYGLGAAIGAKAGNPDKVVVNIAGDGCFRMNMNEIATAVREDIPVIEIIFNNSVLGMVRQWQTLFYGERYSHTVLDNNVDYVKLAEAMGAKGYRVTKQDEVETVLKEAIASGKPAVIECIIQSDDKVFPMVAPGKGLDEVFDEKDLEKGI